MFTNNAKLWFNVRLGLGTGAAGIVKSAYNQQTLIEYSATQIAAPLSTILDQIISTDYLTYYGYEPKEVTCGIIFGTGTGIATMDDTRLFGSQIKTITADNTTCNYKILYNDESKKRYIEAVYVINNTTTQDMTIGEIGLINPVRGKRTSSDNYNYYGCYALIEHTILDEPITIKVGEIGRIIFTIEMEYPTST